MFRQRRRHERYECTLEIRYGVETTDCRDAADTISEGGLHILTNEPLDVGTRVAIVVEFEEHEVKLTGEVVWAIKVPEALRESLVYGMGVELIDASDYWKESLDEWNEQLQHD